MSREFDALNSPHFDPLFSSAVALSGAADAARLNIPLLHRSAKMGIKRAVEFARGRIADPTGRLLLLQGDAGFGKTHVVTSTLYELAAGSEVYPTALQLSANIPEGEVIRTLTTTILQELGTNHFASEYAHVPLRRIARGLLEIAGINYDEWVESTEDLDEPEEIATVAVSSARKVQKTLARANAAVPEAHVIAALMLSAELFSVAKNWLVTGQPAKVGPLELPEARNETAAMSLLRDLAECAMIAGGPLVFALDQVETTIEANSPELLKRIIVQACHVAEAIPSTAVIFSMLTGTFEHDVKPGLSTSLQDRLRNRPNPIMTLEAPSKETQRQVVELRCRELFRRSGLQYDAGDQYRLFPEWLVERGPADTIRGLFQHIRRYRNACRDADDFVTEEQFESHLTGDIEKPVLDDFDKLWEDAKTAESKAVHVSDYERAKDFRWLAEEVAVEMPYVAKTEVEAQDSPETAARVLTVSFFDTDGELFERRMVGFLDEPNRKKRLLHQIEEFHGLVHGATPCMVRRLPIPGVKGGQPRRTRDLRKLQAGPALAEFFGAGGLAAQAPDEDWRRLRTARRFVEARADSPGFEDWRRQRQFLLESAGLGEMTSLLRIDRPVVEDQPENGTVVPMPPERKRGGGAPSEPSEGGEHSQRRLEELSIFVGHGPKGQEVTWNLDRSTPTPLPNFGLLVSGDAGQGKTQLIKAVLAEAMKAGSPVLIFDFKNDYGGEFAKRHGLDVYDLSQGVPFNPFRLPPRGKSGAQAIYHVLDLVGIFQSCLHLGEQQKALLRDAIITAYEGLDVPMREWVDPESTPAPSFSQVVDIIEAHGDGKATALLNRLAQLHLLDLLPGDEMSRLTFDELVTRRSVLSFHNLPNDDGLKRAIAELLLVQVQAHMLRGDQPRALRRLLVFDEAWRASDSDRLISIAREGRAFGAGIIAGSQFADDLASELTGNLATRVHLFNSDADRRRKIVQSTYGSTASAEAKTMLDRLQKLTPFDAIIRNQHFTPFASFRVVPYFQRKFD